MGGSGQKSRLLVRLFDFAFLVQNILKEVDINFFFKVLAKFGDYKHNKDIKEMWEILIFWGGCKILMENSITFNVFFIETFPKTSTNINFFTCNGGGLVTFIMTWATPPISWLARNSSSILDWQVIQKIEFVYGYV